MIQKLKRRMFMIATTLMLVMPMLVPVAVSAAAGTCSNTATNIAAGANGALGSGSNIDCSDTTTNVSTAAASIVKIFSIVVGVVSVIMIIYGGFRYITSGGDSGSVGNAKNTLIYAIVGLVIVALAQLIVHFVLNQSSTVTQ